MVDDGGQMGWFGGCFGSVAGLELCITASLLFSALAELKNPKGFFGGLDVCDVALDPEGDADRINDKLKPRDLFIEVGEPERSSTMVVGTWSVAAGSTGDGAA